MCFALSKNGGSIHLKLPSENEDQLCKFQVPGHPILGDHMGTQEYPLSLQMGDSSFHLIKNGPYLRMICRNKHA